ncbi:hypothetical protein Tco_1369111 [Tanacetum coccineum]
MRSDDEWWDCDDGLLGWFGNGFDSIASITWASCCRIMCSRRWHKQEVEVEEFLDDLADGSTVFLDGLADGLAVFLYSLADGPAVFEGPAEDGAAEAVACEVMWDATQVLISSKEDYNKRLRKAESVETSTSTSQATNSAAPSSVGPSKTAGPFARPSKKTVGPSARPSKSHQRLLGHLLRRLLSHQSHLLGHPGRTLLLLLHIIQQNQPTINTTTLITIPPLLIVTPPQLPFPLVADPPCLCHLLHIIRQHLAHLLLVNTIKTITKPPQIPPTNPHHNPTTHRHSSSVPPPPAKRKLFGEQEEVACKKKPPKLALSTEVAITIRRAMAMDERMPTAINPLQNEDGLVPEA